MSGDQKRYRQLAHKTVVAYVRMAATVVVTVVFRLCLDCCGILITGQEPTATNFWFAHCNKDGSCVLMGVFLFLTSLVGGSFFAWSCEEWITDPDKNPYAKRFSFAIMIEAATWIPTSVCVGKTNALVEWFMDIARDDMVQALLSSGVSSCLTVLCALLTHLAMTNCRGVADPLKVKEAGVVGFGKCLLMTTLSCLGWAAGWSSWQLVLSLMDALEPGRDTHGALLSVVVIASLFIGSVCFYLRFGPEPIIPDPELQQLCYSHGYSSSLRRSLVSYVIYSCLVFILMCCCDPTYGILLVFTRKLVYSSLSSIYDGEASLVLLFLAICVTVVCSLLSAGITWCMEVDESSSMKLSRSVHDACRQMVTRRRSRFNSALDQVYSDGSDVRFLQAREFELSNTSTVDSTPRESAQEEVNDQDLFLPGANGSKCDYSRFDSDGGGYDSPDEVDSERQLRLDRAISRTLCASVLAYDVLGMVVMCVWGMTTLRFYSILFGRLAAVNNAIYVVTCLVYAAAVATSALWFTANFFPSPEELKMQREHLKRQHSDFSPDNTSAPLLEKSAAAEEALIVAQKLRSITPTSSGGESGSGGSCAASPSSVEVNGMV
eukprot:TRINITY_DN49470_c0_g1_i1.p1 TRINITY_DN49470_c0_g1~~TRINITY_DN49470_c0_g1_i1.p1  ORF type:complete len:604 (+),score=106.11 TRINITY_DN49470_c0_g1_i1:145-1956(+)